MTYKKENILESEFPTEIEKPFPEIHHLIINLIDECCVRVTPKKRAISFYKSGSRQCYVLLKGSVALYRSSDGVILNSESAPFVFGVNSQLTDTKHLYIRTQEESEIACISLDKVNQIIKERDLWQSLCMLLIYSAARVYSHCLTISSKHSSYEIIRLQLLELDQESAEVKDKITAANYILSRTFLSRSGVMRILSRLKSEEKIITRRGVLIAVKDLSEGG